MRSWSAGSIAGRVLDIVWPVLPFFLVAVILAFIVSGALNAMALGDELAAAQGVRLVRTRIVTVAAITLLAGGATAIAGPIGFVGLMVPHVARWFAGPDQRWILAYSILLAQSLLLASDILGRVVIYPSELPVGIVTAFVGAPVLIVLVRRKKASRAMTAIDQTPRTQTVDFGRRVLAFRCGGFAARFEWRSIIVCVALAVAVVAAAVLALMTGSYQLSIGQVVSALTGGEDGLVHDIVLEWRLPRVAATVVFGAALGVSGAMFQSRCATPSPVRM